MIMPNLRTVTLKLSRKQVCDIALALDYIDCHLRDDQLNGDAGKRWKELRAKVKEQLHAHDAKWEAENE